MRAWSIRARLTAWYTGVLVLALVVQGAAIFFLQHRLALGELDTEVAQDIRTVSHGITEESHEGMTWPDAVGDAMREMLLPEREVAVFCGDTLIGERPAGAGAALAAVRVGEPRTQTTASGVWRAGAAPVASPRADCRVVVARAMKPVLRTRALTFDAIWMGLLLAAVVAAAGGFWIARRALQPLTRLAEECERIPTASVAGPPGSPRVEDGARLTLPGTRDELDRVVTAFNGLLGRLEKLLETQRQFMADASHELRTPVSVVRNAAEIALSRAHRDPEDYRETLDIVAAQSRRMTRLVDDLFLLARVDAGQRPLTRARLYFDDVVRESVDALSVVARGREVTIDADLELDVEIEGDEHLLRQLVVNVLQNAVSYTRAGSRVDVRLRRVGTQVETRVHDQGAGVPDAFRERVFERFARLPIASGSHDAADPRAAAKDEEAGGAGLGLAIARAIADLHGGAVTLRASGPAGSTFVITLPALPA